MGVNDSGDIICFYNSMRWRTTSLAMALLAALAAMGGRALAVDTEHHKVANGVSVYLGVMPSELIRKHRDQYPAGMHGGIPAHSAYHHVMVALFDEATGERIDDARVMAAVEEVGATTDSKKLEPMAIAGTITYGNYFAMMTDATYRVRLHITRAGAARVIETQLQYYHVHNRR